MKKICLRTLSLLLALLMLASCALLVACSQPDDPSQPDQPDTPDQPDVPETPDAPATEDYLLSIPKQNYGKTFTFLSSPARVAELNITNEDDAMGSTVDTAVFYRNNRVSEHLGVTFNNITSPMSWDGRAEYLNRIYSSYSAGDQDFQLISIYEAFAAENAISGYYYDVNSIEAVDLSSPWYVQSWVKNTLINDRSYMIVSDLSLSMWNSIYALYFNKQMADQIEVTDVLYKMAADGDFTFEYLLNCAEMVTVEDGNQSWDEFDTYGFALNRFDCRAMVTYFDLPLSFVNEDEEYELCFYNERTETIYGEIHDAMWNSDGIYKNTLYDGDVTMTIPMFKDNRLLFLSATLGNSQELRSMDGDFGILPWPKYTEDQDSYFSHASDAFTLFAIPGQTDDPEFCGTVTNALSAESKYSVIPSFYDVVLKGRTAKDEQSSAMLDVIRNSLHFDFVFAHLTAMNFMWTRFGNIIFKPEATSFLPYYEMEASSYQESLDKIMDTYWRNR